jgi:hypothetical protein
MLAHERYFKEMDREALHARYGKTYEGVRQWIDENIGEEAQYEKAVYEFDSAMVRAAKNPELYPPRYLLTTYMSGGFKRRIMPLGRQKESADQCNRVARCRDAQRQRLQSRMSCSRRSSGCSSARSY